MCVCVEDRERVSSVCGDGGCVCVCVCVPDRERGFKRVGVWRVCVCVSMALEWSCLHVFTYCYEVSCTVACMCGGVCL